MPVHCASESQPATGQPLCSVCVANYNGTDFIASCLESVLSQEFDHPIEIIVHDDASTDDSVAFIRNHFPNVKLLTSDNNVGFCVSNNRMVAEARGRFVLLLNNDATLFPDALQTLHDYAVIQKRQGILGLPQYDMQTGELIDIGSRLDLFLNPIPNLDRTRRQVGMVTGACFWIPKWLWDELGGFPEFFGSLAEDLYLSCVARLRGYSVEAVPQSGFRHWVGRSFGGGKIMTNSLHTTYHRRSMSERNKTFVMMLCYPAPYAYLIIPLHLVVLSVEGLLISMIKRDLRLWNGIYLNCLNALWATRETLLSSRTAIQQYRNTGLGFFSSHTLILHKLTMLRKYGLPSVE